MECMVNDHVSPGFGLGQLHAHAPPDTHDVRLRAQTDPCAHARAACACTRACACTWKHRVVGRAQLHQKCHLVPKHSSHQLSTGVCACTQGVDVRTHMHMSTGTLFHETCFFVTDDLPRCRNDSSPSHMRVPSRGVCCRAAALKLDRPRVD